MSMPPEFPGRHRTAVWREATVEDSVESPLADWTYDTDERPFHISESDLKLASNDVQRRTALIWFFRNLAPWEPDWSQFDFSRPPDTEMPDDDDLPESMFTSHPFGTGFGGVDDGAIGRIGSFVPMRINSLDALNGEFGGTIPSHVIENLAHELGNSWSWKANMPTRNFRIEGAETSGKELVGELLREIRRLKELLGTPSGTIGRRHNGPPPDLVLPEEETGETLAGLDRLEQAVAEPGEETVEALTAERPFIYRAMTASARYAGKQADAYLTEVMKGLGQRTATAIAATAGLSLAASWINLHGLIDALIRYLTTH